MWLMDVCSSYIRCRTPGRHLFCDHDMLSHSRLAAANSNRHRTYEARTIKAVDLRLSDIHAAPLLATTAGPRRTSTTPCSMPDGQDGFQDHSSSLNYISRRRLAALGTAVLAAIEQQQPAAASVVPNQMPAFPPGSLTVGSNPSNSTEASPGAAAPDSPAAPGSCTRLSPEVAANFTNAVSEALNELGVASVEELQRERFKLFDQEYSYYYEANKDRLPRVPDLSDESGGLSNRTYFNFVSYIGWKVAARHVVDSGQRTALCRRVGELLLPLIAPGEVEGMRAEARKSPRGAVSEQAAAAAITRLLDQLQSSGYICGWQVVWGEQPGGWPPDWYQQEPGLIGQLPGSRSLPSDLPSDLDLPPDQKIFQIKLLQPADIQASVAIRSEDDGFWGRHVSSMVARLLEAGGWRADASEYFYQDDWSGPSTLNGKLLLLFGDPLQQVDIPWTPTTLVQDYTCSTARGSGGSSSSSSTSGGV